MAYRKLTAQDIEQLTAQGCTAKDWTEISVHEGLQLKYVQYVNFSGTCRIGRFEKSFQMAGGIEKHSGIYHATLHNVTVGDNCCIENIKNYIANYDIEDDCFIENVDIILVDGKTSFGNGTEVAVLNETGGREVTIHDHLTAHEAYMVAMYRHRPRLVSRLKELAAEYAAQVSSERGRIAEGMNCTIAHRDGSFEKTKIKEVHTFEGMARQKTDGVESGDICAVVGLENFEIGDTICDFENPEPLPTIAIDEPTMSMLFTINDSPFFGKEGKYCTSRHINDRLEKELEKDLALRVEKTEGADRWIVSGRGVLHLSILIETMRREGYELQVGQPQVIYKEIDGERCEPIEELTINVPEEFASKMIDMVTRRKGEMTSMITLGDRVDIEFNIPSRGIIGLRTNVLTASQGEAIMAHRYKEYQPYKGDIQRRSNGSLIALEGGTAYAYAIDHLQDRGRFFISPQDEVYAGQVVGEHVHEKDLVINVTKAKQLTNMRASGADEKARIVPPIIFSLEEALEYIKEDEYVEVTPKSMRMRKTILDHTARKRAGRE